MSASDESPQAGVTQQVLDRYRGTVSGPVSPYRWLMTRTMTHVSTAVTTSAVTMCHQCQCQSQCQCAPSWDLMLIMSAWCSAAHAQSLTISGVQIWTVAGESEVITAWPRLSSSPSPGHSGHLGPVQLARRHGVSPVRQTRDSQHGHVQCVDTRGGNEPSRSSTVPGKCP